MSDWGTTIFSTAGLAVVAYLSHRFNSGLAKQAAKRARAAERRAQEFQLAAEQRAAAAQEAAAARALEAQREADSRAERRQQAAIDLAAKGQRETFEVAERRRALAEQLARQQKAFEEFLATWQESFRGPVDADTRNARIAQRQPLRARMMFAFGDEAFADKIVSSLFDAEDANANRFTPPEMRDRDVWTRMSASEKVALEGMLSRIRETQTALGHTPVQLKERKQS